MVELTIAVSILAFGLLFIASMFSTGYVDVAAGGKTTMAVTAARQVVEDMRLLPAQGQFANLLTLNNFDTNNSNTLPAADPALSLARKFRYMLAGRAAAADAWGITSTNATDWGPSLSVSGITVGGRGQIAVADVGPTVGTLVQVTVTVTAPGRPPVVLTTLVSRM